MDIEILKQKLVARSRQFGPALVVAVLAGSAGLYTMGQSGAATFAAIREAEDGVLTTNATEVTDTNAANGLAVKFSTAITPPAGSRDPLKQPFASSSIWNMPIGSSAVYVDAGLDNTPRDDVWAPMPQIDDDIIVLKPSAPLISLMQSDAGWSGSSRCGATGGQLAQVPFPANFVLPSNSTNASAAILKADGRTILHAQPLTRCTAGGIATSLLTFDDEDLYGQGISGSHGGSYMSALGGSIRLGELRPGQQGPKHALKMNVDSPYALYNCATRAQCFRWPALASDSGADSDYGTANNNQNTAMKMGSLLAIPPSVNINTMGLESEPGRQLAWTLQNYGIYIVDSTGGAAIAIESEFGPDGTLRNQFQQDYGMELEQRVRDNTTWSRDFQKLVDALYVVNNNSPTSVGGGGTPRQPLAPAISP